MGLETEDISKAFQLELQRQQVVTGRERVGLERERIGLLKDKLSFDKLKAMSKPEGTAAMQNYKFYVKQETGAGRTPKSFATWEEDEKTGKQNDYKFYVSQGGDLSFHEWDLELRRAGATAISLGARADIAVGKRFRTPEYVDRVVKEEIGDLFTGFLSDLEAPEQKLKMRRRVYADIRRAFPKAKITGVTDSRGIQFFVDGDKFIYWTDPDIPKGVFE